MSRHRSPAGRHAHPRSAPPTAIPGAWPRRADAPPAPARDGGGVALLERPAALAHDPHDPHAAHAFADPREFAAPPREFAAPPREFAAPPREFAAPPREFADPARPTAPAGRPAGPRHSAPAVRNGLVAAAATAGLLSVAAPLVPALPAADPAGSTTLALAAEAEAAADTPESAAPSPVQALSAPVDGRLLAASILPVPGQTDVLPPQADAESLLKAAGLADAARALEEQRLAREAAAQCDVPLRGLGSVKGFVRDAARFISCLYDQPALIGVAGRARVSDHPRGLAIDFMTDRERGDRIADCALANQDELGISYVIWRQRVNYGDGWEPMSDRGGATENHYDHVHVSFERGGGSGGPLAAACS
ncbi:hypothetical protein [Pseudonocardia broussonetiae]|uniref:ARB-07466-like C-terminal domain-containing protein n=1 Tax=Pseudonocardia broussonetiae TaxID=2736640 RepID=A0A6M6JFM2_9PSEU|nr:hypothetical protein [Pseudonocardia broussonetiae]QJY46798.1 hypothetical protein HOP40_14040 [Pseudonocardia broussonetiae]